MAAPPVLPLAFARSLDSRRFRAWARRALVATVALAAVATALSLPARQLWFADLLTFARQQLFALALAALAAALLARLPRLALAAALVAAANGYLVAATLEPPAPTPAGGERLRVLTLNVLTQNYYTNRVERFFRRAGADVLVLQELTPYWGEQLESLRDLYPHVWPALTPFTGEIAILSRHPIAEAEVLPAPPGTVAGPHNRPVRAVLQVGKARVALYGVHPDTPRSPEQWRRRNAQLRWLAVEIQARGAEPRIVAGDFNTPPWSPHLADFLRATGLRDASGGGPRRPTRQPRLLAPYLSWLGAPVDHLLVSAGVAVEAFAVGRDVWSDHLPVIADLALPAATAAQLSGVSPAR